MTAGNGRKRAHRIQIRMSDKEYSFLKDQVKKSGLSVQDYVLSAVNSSTVISSEILDKLTDINKSISKYTELMREIGCRITDINRKIAYSGVSEALNSISLHLSNQLKKGDFLWQSIKLLIVELRHINPS